MGSSEKGKEWPPSVRGMSVASDEVEKATQIIHGLACHVS